MIANSGHDENGKYSGGAAGDQTGGEYAIIEWYPRPWLEAWEPPTRRIGEEVAKLAKHAAKNDNIGYDQLNRLSYDVALRETPHNDPAEITKKVESDCSAGVAAALRAVGRRLGIKAMADISPYNTTWTLGKALEAAGWIKHTEAKYLNSDEYLGKGWVLNNPAHHVAINVSYGSKYKFTYKKPNFRRILNAATAIRTRKILSKIWSVGTYKKGTTVRISGVFKGSKNWWGTLANGRGYIKLGTVAAGIKYKLPVAKFLRTTPKKSASNHIKKLPKGTMVVLSRIKKGDKYFWGELADGSGWILLS